MADTQQCPFCGRLFMLRGCEQDKAINWDETIKGVQGGTVVVSGMDKAVMKLAAVLRQAREELVEWAREAGYDMESGVAYRDDEAVILKQIDDVLEEVGNGL